MNPKDIENMTKKTLQSWDGIAPAEVSPFLWTRIRANIFSQEPQKLIAQPAMKFYLGLWIVLVAVNLTFWFSPKSDVSYSTSDEVRTTFFSDDNPYSTN